jgi:hypothetical protein
MLLAFLFVKKLICVLESLFGLLNPFGQVFDELFLISGYIAFLSNATHFLCKCISTVFSSASNSSAFYYAMDNNL